MPPRTTRATSHILYIDTTDNDLVQIFLFDGKKQITESFDFLPSAEELPNLIEKFLKTRKVLFSDLSRIAVKIGPGFFSRVRTGVVAANALAFGLGIPVIGVRGRVDFAKIAKSKPVPFVKPFYGAKPHITLPKKNK